LRRQPKKRLGSGITGYEDVKNAEFFLAEHPGTSVFEKIMGRELDPPVLPECDIMGTEEWSASLSDESELG